MPQVPPESRPRPPRIDGSRAETHENPQNHALHQTAHQRRSLNHPPLFAAAECSRSPTHARSGSSQPILPLRAGIAACFLAGCSRSGQPASPNSYWKSPASRRFSHTFDRRTPAGSAGRFIGAVPARRGRCSFTPPATRSSACRTRTPRSSQPPQAPPRTARRTRAIVSRLNPAFSPHPRPRDVGVLGPHLCQSLLKKFFLEPLNLGGRRVWPLMLLNPDTLRQAERRSGFRDPTVAHAKPPSDSVSGHAGRPQFCKEFGVEVSHRFMRTELRPSLGCE